MAIAINVIGSYNDRDIKRAQADLVKLGDVASGQSKSISDSMKSLGDGMVNAGGKLTTHLTLPILGVGAVAIKMASDVDNALREVNTLLGETGAVGEANFKQLQSGVADLSTEVGIAQLALTEGLYQAISAGVPKENAFTFMEVAAKASIAGVTDVNTAVDGLTTVINAFGMDTSDAQVVADSMFAAVKGGKTTFDELSESLFQIAPAAAAANVGMDEVNAGIATLTSAGVPTSVAATQMRAALVGLQRPSEDMTKIFNNLGY
jgi:TP901 family phage tail tape measure protein